MKTVGLSIDFDFFSKEDPLWDLGHSETHPIYASIAWSARYHHLDLEKECDPKVHADFMPNDLWKYLLPRGLVLPKDTPCGFADSHLAAYKWFKDEPLDMIVHIDAHHDCWPVPSNKKVDCGSWLGALPFDAICVYPKWKDPKLDHDPIRTVKILKFDDFEMEEEGLIMKIFVCRSGSWLPPHLDSLFADFMEMMANTTAPCALEPILQRPEIDYKEIAKHRKMVLGEFKKFQKES